MALREAIEGPYAGQKPSLREWTKKRFGGVLLVDHDGTLASKGGAGLAEPGMDHIYMHVPRPLATAGMMWDAQGEPMVTQSAGPGFEEVLTDECLPTQPMEFSLDDFFADPSVLFSGPSSTGFTGIGDQRTAGDSMTYLFGNF